MKTNKGRMIVMNVDGDVMDRLMEFLNDECGVELMTPPNDESGIIFTERENYSSEYGRPIPKSIASLKSYDDDDIDSRISDLLTEIGIPVHVLGYGYLRYALQITIEDISIINSITKALYPTIAQQFGTTPSRVERAIRHAIEIAFDRGNTDTLYSLFGYSINFDKGKPTNSEFVATLADRLRLKLKHA